MVLDELPSPQSTNSSDGLRQAYSMTVADDAAVVERVAGLLRRRGHRVLRMSFAPSGRPGVCRLDLEVQPKAARGERIGLELARLEAVLTVDLP